MRMYLEIAQTPIFSSVPGLDVNFFLAIPELVPVKFFGMLRDRSNLSGPRQGMGGESPAPLSNAVSPFEKGAIKSSNGLISNIPSTPVTPFTPSDQTKSTERV